MSVVIMRSDTRTTSSSAIGDLINADAFYPVLPVRIRTADSSREGSTTTVVVT